MRLHHKEKIAILLMLDVMAMVVSFIAALFLGHRPPAVLSLVSYYDGGIVTLLSSTVLILFILDVYSLHKIPERFMHQVSVIGVGLVLSSILSTFAFFFSRDTVPRMVFLLFYFFAGVLIIAFRYVFSRLTLSFIYWKILILGDKNESEATARLIDSRKYLHSRVVGYVSADAGTGTTGCPACLGTPDRLLSILEREAVDQVIVAAAKVDDGQMKLLLECMHKKIKVSDFRTVMEDITGNVPIEHLNDNWFILELGASDKRYFWYAKRLFDILVALVGLGMTAPLLPVVALMSKLDSRGPVFYSQQRVGRGNKTFRVWKLRTMIDDADKGNVHWTAAGDDRITRVGKMLRKIRLDEVPQLYNVLKGDMSLIGPRPEAASLAELYAKEIPYYCERHMVTPGVTGWAQINYPYGNSVQDAREKLKYDFYYIKNRDLVLDAVIFLRTIRIVLTGKGAI